MIDDELNALFVSAQSSNNWWRHHNNAPGHISFRLEKYLAQHSEATLLIPSYSPCRHFYLPKNTIDIQRGFFTDCREV
ncbi:hypothetical protein TNCV_4628451 [Trichonephila clavipes]|nr:hypothetical protein TNCV_4628451 [Trichonephila clavipes]